MFSCRLNADRTTAEGQRWAAGVDMDILARLESTRNRTLQYFDLGNDRVNRGPNFGQLDNMIAWEAAE
ncbi:MAG: hypothetical protein M3539_03200 [Acidobacteriota bacterium]|nr:hypothetical protein [Acidobacteriota bacterium]